MKSIDKLFKNIPDTVFLAVVSGITFVGSLAIIFLLIWPSFSTWQAGQMQETAERDNISKIQTSVSYLQNINKDKLVGWREFMDTLLPTSNDLLHFITLQEIIAKAVGVQVTNLSLGQQVAAKVAAPVAPSATPGVAPVSQLTYSSLSVSYSSTFDNLLKLIESWSAADRAVVVNDISISSVVGSDLLTYDITYALPIASLGSTAEAGTLTTADQSLLDKLSQNVIYSATPSAYNYDKTSPFK